MLIIGQLGLLTMRLGPGIGCWNPSVPKRAQACPTHFLGNIVLGREMIRREVAYTCLLSLGFHVRLSTAAFRSSVHTLPHERYVRHPAEQS